MKQLLEDNDKGHVIATCRNPSASTGLIHLKDKFADRLKILQLDLTVESSIEVLLLSPSFSPLSLLGSVWV